MKPKVKCVKQFGKLSTGLLKLPKLYSNPLNILLSYASNKLSSNSKLLKINLLNFDIISKYLSIIVNLV